MTAAPLSIAIAGAGSVGCFVGGMLRAGGHRVALLARPRIAAELAAHGLKVTSLEDAERRLPPGEVAASDDPARLGMADVVLVTVKSGDTGAIAELIAKHARPDATVVSLQNGVTNVPLLRERLPGRRVLGGMVPFNVLALGNGHFHRATSGDIVLETDAASTAERLSTPDLVFRASADIVGVQWGKLLANLNNGLNALSGLPLRDQLARRAWRVLLAEQMSEALAAMKAEGVTPVPAPPLRLPPWLIPHLLKLPDGVFRLVARRMVKIDPTARSSMWEDLQRGRRTEIDHLQGFVAELAGRHGLWAPVCARVAGLVRQAEAAGKGSPGLTADEVRGG